MSIEIKGKTYEVRELCVEDIEMVSVFLNKIDFDIKNFFNNDELLKATKKGKIEVEQIGIKIILEMINFILKNYHKASKEFCNWMGSLIGVKGEEVKKMPIQTPFLIFQELAKENNLADFFGSAVA